MSSASSLEKNIYRTDNFERKMGITDVFWYKIQHILSLKAEF